MGKPINICAALRLYVRNRLRWDDICDKCGRCCFEREIDPDGDVVIDYAAPCEFLNTETRLCNVYSTRFATCDRCAKVNVLTALYDPLLPETCAYARMFRKSNPL